MLDVRMVNRPDLRARVEFHGPVEKDGRQSFTLRWIDDYGRWRGQCFHAIPSEHFTLAAPGESSRPCVPKGN